ncbi:MAG: TraB/GumN family protein [Mangrovimonas sp.]|nr:TraB/GumN family protein [Mangrovimonas sp.]
MKKTALLLFGFLLTNMAFAQDLENTLLWEISGNGLEKPSYIFGTIHMTCDATLKEKVVKALDSTTLLVLELDMDDPAMTMQMMKYMYMKDDKTIKDLVSDEDYSLLNNFFKDQMGMPLENMQRMKPFFLVAMFYPKLLDCPMQVVEQELMKVAHDQNEEVLGLETIEEQMSIFDEIPYDEQVTDLLSSAKDGLKSSKDIFVKMQQTYKEENINEMAHLVTTDTTQSMVKHLDKMLYNRNKNWIPKIGAFAKEQPTFFGVGAGHLAGELGVIALLRKEGYIVKPVQ